MKYLSKCAQFIFVVTLILALTVCGQVYRVLQNVLDLQQSSAVMTVFSQNDLSSDLYTQLEDRLRSMPQVRSLTVTSPQEGLKIALSQMPAELNAEWIQKKDAEMVKNGQTLLPYAFDLYLKSWHKKDVENLKKSILDLKSDQNKNLVADVYYNAEKQSALSALTNYYRWIQRAGVVCFVLVMLGALISFPKMFQNMKSSDLGFFQGLLSILALGFFAAILSSIVFWVVWIWIFKAESLLPHLELIRLFLVQWLACIFVFCLSFSSIRQQD